MLDAAPPFPSAQDLGTCGANDVLADAGDTDYITLQICFGTAATNARAAALQLLAGVCGMLLDPDDRAAPYKARFISFVDDRRSLSPEDIDQPALARWLTLRPPSRTRYCARAWQT